MCCKIYLCSIFGCVYDATRAHADPEKVNLIHKILAPETATPLQKFLRLVTYLSPFIPSCSSFTTPLCGLLKKGTEFFWNNSYQEAFDKSQIVVLQGNHTVVPEHLPACHCAGECIPKWPRCCAPSRWLPSCLCLQCSYTCGAALCQNRTWTAHLCLWSRIIPHLCLWPCLHYLEWPQASWTDQYQESGRYTSSSTENAATAPKLWCHHQALTWQKDAGCRCLILLCTPQGSRDTSKHHHQPYARWYQWCPTCSTSIPWPQKQLNIASLFEVKLSSFLNLKGRRSSKQYMKDIWELASAKTEPDTVCIGLESTQTSNVSLNHAHHANITTHRNHNSCSSQHWLQSPWQLLSAEYFHFDISEYLVVIDYILQDVHCQKNPCISMQCLQDHLSPEGTLCRTWHPRGTPYWQ